MQNHYNLLYREEEREMLPLCADQGIGGDPVEPAGARPADPRLGRRQRPRIETDEFGKTLYRPEDAAIVERVAEIAERRGVPRAQVALAWVSRNPVVTAPIVGATKPHHLDDAVAALESRSPTTRWRSWRSRTSRTPSPGSESPSQDVVMG